MNCPQCHKEMEQESQEHFFRNVSRQYDYDTKEWTIPECIDIGFEKHFWCKNDGCSMKNKYIYHDEPHKYILIKKIINELKKLESK